MTESNSMPAAQWVRLTGTISGYQARRESANFVFTERDRTTFGVVAIAASLAGLGGQAMAMASNATALEEEADHVSFTLDGKEVRGWLWRSPFKDGDEVTVAAQWEADHYECYGMARPADRTIALYPHCTRSRQKHIWNAVKWWVYVSLFFELGLLALASTIDSMTLAQFWTRVLGAGGGWVLGAVHLFAAVAIASMTKKWMPFTTVAEKVFTVLDLPEPARIDLVKSSKGRRLPTDGFEFGAMYFRY